MDNLFSLADQRQKKNNSTTPTATGSTFEKASHLIACLSEISETTEAIMEIIFDIPLDLRQDKCWTPFLIILQAIMNHEEMDTFETEEEIYLWAQTAIIYHQQLIDLSIEAGLWESTETHTATILPFTR